jgi:hypothetical protein
MLMSNKFLTQKSPAQLRTGLSNIVPQDGLEQTRIVNGVTCKSFMDSKILFVY